MAKKSFKENNPALQFLTIEEPTPEAADTKTEENTQHTQQTQSTQPNAKKGDLKGKRFNLLFYSTDTLENLKKLTTMQQAESVNALINEILTAYTEAHTEEISKYNSLFNK